MSTAVPMGIVSLKAEGAYAADKLYKKGMWVTSSGSSYAYINPTPSTGVPLSDTTHWQQIASVGGQDLVDAAVAARDAAQVQAALAQGYAAQLAAGLTSPGVYATFAALVAAKPTGDTKIYVVTADGFWYYWNGSAWVAGGVYQATGIGDKTVTEDKLRFNASGFGKVTEYVESLELPPSIKDFTCRGCTVSFSNGLNLSGATISGTSVTWQQITLPYSKMRLRLIKSEYFIIAKNATEVLAMCVLNSNYGQLFKFTDTTFVSTTIEDFPALGSAFFIDHDAELIVSGNTVTLYSYTGSVRTLVYTFNINDYYSANYVPCLGLMSHDATNALGYLARFYGSATVYPNSYAHAIGNALGDSITAAGGYLTQLISSLGLSVYTNYGTNGTTIAEQTSGQASAFCNRYSDMSNTCDFVTVFGGTNDYGVSIELGTPASTEKTTFYGALKVLCAGLVTKYPSQRIVFITPLQRDWQGGGQVAGVGANGLGYTLIDYCDAIKAVCRDYAIPVLDLYAESGITITNITTWSADRLHPNAAGHIRIGKQLAKFLEKYPI